MLLKRMSSELLLDETYLEGLAARASKHYKRYTVTKKSGSKRSIFHPSRELKAIQRWIKNRVLCDLPVHESAAAYRSGKGVKDHVAKHKRSRYLLRLDFKNFFPSLTADDISAHVAKYRTSLPEWWSDNDTHYLVAFVCVDKRLTIGAVTSPDISNTLCFDLDQSIWTLCEKSGVVYTRYADDLYFSTKKKDLLGAIENRVRETVKKLEYPSKLKFNDEKTRHLSKRCRRIVTGLVLTSDGGISIGRNRKRKVRSQIHKWDSLSADERRSLAGFLAYAMDVEPSFVNSLYYKYGAERMQDIVAYGGESD